MRGTFSAINDFISYSFACCAYFLSFAKARKQTFLLSHSWKLRSKQMNCLLKLRIYILIHFLIFMCNCFYHLLVSLVCLCCWKHLRHARLESLRMLSSRLFANTTIKCYANVSLQVCCRNVNFGIEKRPIRGGENLREPENP